MPGAVRAMAAAVVTSASPSRPDAGRIWIVTSRATSDCHSLADALTSTTAPMVSEARNVMMAMTEIRARPAMESTGTSGVSTPCIGSATTAVTVWPSGPLMCVSTTRASFIIVQAPLVQHQATGVELVHQRDGVRGDED